MSTTLVLRAVTFRFAVLLALLQGGNAAISVGTATAAQGALDVRIPIGLASFEAEVVGLRFVFNYDAEQLAFKSMDIGEAALEANKALTFETEFPGRLQVVIQGLDRDVILDGEMAVLHFDISPVAPLTPIGLLVTEGTAFGANATVIPLELNPGLLLVEPAEVLLPTWTPSVTDTPTPEPSATPVPAPTLTPTPQSFIIGDIELAEWLPAEVIELLNRDPGTARFFMLVVAASAVLLLLGLLLNLTDRRR
jgi:hypothetical protein